MKCRYHQASPAIETKGKEKRILHTQPLKKGGDSWMAPYLSGLLDNYIFVKDAGCKWNWMNKNLGFISISMYEFQFMSKEGHGNISWD